MTSMLSVVSLSARAFAVLGLEEIAYVKPVIEDDEPAFAIHAADGTCLAVIEDRQTAFAVIRRNDLEPASLH